MEYEYSEAEKKLISFFGYADRKDLINPMALYRILAEKAFIENLQGPAVEALRRAYEALQSCSVYRMSPEFDKLLFFEDTKAEKPKISFKNLETSGKTGKPKIMLTENELIEKARDLFKRLGGIGNSDARIVRGLIEHKAQAAPELELAEMQLLGFAHASNGYSIKDLIESMGLAQSEWEQIKNKTYLNEKDIEEIDYYFEKRK